MCAAVGLSILQKELTAREDAPRTVPLDFDPFVVPSHFTALAAVLPRARTAVAGTVEVVSCRNWVGGPTLEVTLEDGTGSLVLAFLGRRRVAGIRIGRTLVAGGTVIRRRGRNVILNPYVWLTKD